MVFVLWCSFSLLVASTFSFAFTHTSLPLPLPQPQIVTLHSAHSAWATPIKLRQARPRQPWNNLDTAITLGHILTILPVTVIITTAIMKRRLDDKLAQCLCQVIQSSATAVCTPPHRNSDSKMPSYVHITLAPAERALYEAVALWGAYLFSAYLSTINLASREDTHLLDLDIRVLISVQTDAIKIIQIWC